MEQCTSISQRKWAIAAGLIGSSDSPFPSPSAAKISETANGLCKATQLDRPMPAPIQPSETGGKRFPPMEVAADLVSKSIAEN